MNRLGLFCGAGDTIEQFQIHRGTKSRTILAFNTNAIRH